MKYKILKETPYVADGAIIDTDNWDIFIYNDRFDIYHKWKYASETYDWLNWHIKNHPEDFEEVKEPSKPRWKVGDKVVKVYKNFSPDYLSIYRVALSNDWDNWLYNNDDIEADLRDPTSEELFLYFS